MKSTNHTAPVRCSRQITIDASPERIWAILTNINGWANWQTDINSSILHGALKPGSTFGWKTGGAKIHSTLHTVSPVTEFGWTGKTFGLFAIHNWTLSEIEGQTIVAADESMEGLLAGLFKKSFNKNLEKGMVRWLDLLRREAEK